MFEKNNPVLISMPRCGSTVTGKMLYNISHHRYGSKNYLNQLTTVVPQYYAEFERRDGCIQQVAYRREKNGFVKEFENRAAIIQQRMALLAGDTQYTMKLIADDYTPKVLDFLRAHYDFILLERRDTLSQILSYSTMMVTNQHEYRKHDPFAHSYFDLKHCLMFLDYMIQYKRVKQQVPEAKVIYYEDLMALGGNTAALQQLLGLPVETVPAALLIDTVPTPYTSDLEDLLHNRAEWLEHKPTILRLLAAI
jgi:hypothetical protein